MKVAVINFAKASKKQLKSICTSNSMGSSEIWDECNKSGIYPKFHCYSQLIPYSMTVHYPTFSSATMGLPTADITNKICCYVLNTCHH